MTGQLLLDYETSREIYSSFSDGEDIVSLCIKNKIDFEELDNIVKYFSNKDIEHMTAENEYVSNIYDITKKYNLLPHQVYDIIYDFAYGEKSIVAITKDHSIYQVKLYNILKAYYGEDNVPHRPKGPNKHKAEDAVVKETTRKAPQRDRKRSLNAHQLNKKLKLSSKRYSKRIKAEEKLFPSKQPIVALVESVDGKVKSTNAPKSPVRKPIVDLSIKEEPVKQVEDNKYFMFAEQKIINEKLTKLVIEGENVVKAGLVDGRHDISQVNGTYIFNETLSDEQLSDFSYQEDVVRGFINANLKFDEDKNIISKLMVYCTGLQSVLASVIKVCYDMKVDLCLMHFNGISKYEPQIISGNSWGYLAGPLNLIPTRNVYLYDTTAEEVLENLDNLFVTTLNTHGEDGSFSNGVFVITTSIFKLYENFSYFSIMMHQSEDNHYRNSVLCAKCSISNEEGFKFGTNLAKSFNFKKYPYRNMNSEDIDDEE